MSEEEKGEKTGLQELFLDYVGNALKLDPETSPEISVDMIVDVLAAEFPDLVMALASENFLRGYSQALQDMEDLQEKESQLPNEDKKIELKVTE